MVYDEASCEVERSLLQLENGPISDSFNSPHNPPHNPPHQKVGSLLLTVKELGVWLVKFSPTGLIYNRRELILPELIKHDAQITFRNLSSFHNAVLGAYEDEIHQGNIEYSGSNDIIHLFRDKCLKSGEMASTRSIFESPIREGRTILPSIGDEQPLKKGWLLKKRDILTGWKCRYFELFRGKLLYYRDANDINPRKCVLIANAEIHKVQQIKIKRASDHFGLIIETKKPEKLIRLASERTGIEGKAEAESWFQALIYASDVVDVITDESRTSILKKNPSISLKPLEVKDVKRELTRKLSVVFPVALGGGDEDSKTPMIICAIIILLLAVILHYIWIVKKWMSTKLYLTLAVLIVVLMVIFFQEFVMASTDEENSNSSNNNTNGKELASKKSSQPKQKNNVNSSGKNKNGKKPMAGEVAEKSIMSEEETEDAGMSTDQYSDTSSEGGNDIIET